MAAPYKVKSLGASSQRYGDCECCHRWMSDAHILRHGRKGCDVTIGHRKCLERVQKPNNVWHFENHGGASFLLAVRRFSMSWHASSYNNGVRGNGRTTGDTENENSSTKRDQRKNLPRDKRTDG